MSKAVGENILNPDVLTGETNILEHMRKDIGLEQYYTEGSGFKSIYAMVSGVVAQLCNKFPHMSFLEIGAGTGGATGAILEKIGHSFSSYTYTDISSGFFERATERFQSQAHKIEFKTLDITKDPASQDFSPNSYDIVIASNVLHATAPLKETLEHTRKLLKPGGFLVLVELIRNDSMRVGQIMGGLPGWWCGETDGRLWSPLLTLEGWDTLLRETGFGGIETNSPMPIPEDNGAIIVAKAQNDQVRRLSKPLISTPDVGQGKGCLVILGGKNAVTSEFCDQLAVLLRPHFKEIIRVDHLNNLPELPETVHVLSLTECDENLFEDLKELTFQNLKRLLGSVESALWLLQGTGSSNLYAGVTLGFFRTICHEYSVMSGALLQTLDIENDIRNVSPILLAESILRLREQLNLKKRGESNQVLWNFEPELYLENGQIQAMRIRQNEDQNARYNSAKRSITSLVDVSRSTALRLVWFNESYILREQNEIESLNVDDYVSVRVSCSYLASIKTSAGFVFVSLGTDMKTGEKTLCLSSRNASIVRMPKSWTLRVEGLEMVDGHFMSFLVADLMAEQVLRMLPTTGTVVAFEPDPVVSALLSKKMADKGRRILLVTSRPGAKAKNWLYLHPHSSQRLIDVSLPADVTLFADVSGVDSNPQSLGSRIAASLSPVCEKITFSSIVAREASSLPELAPGSVTELLSKAAAFASFSSQLGPVPIADVAPISVLPLTQVVSSTQIPSPSSLIYWQVDQYVPVSVEPIIERQDLFRPDRTYWLAGLSGALGQSLADFMIAHNAKYVVLSSRTPKLDERWVEWHKSRGATIACLKG
jgi:SAM-dependent methyltransferase